MHRLIAVVICAFWVTVAQAQITVVGTGVNDIDARNNGFRLAVEQAIGSIVASETEVQNGRLVRDEILNYAAGYVDRFEIVNVQEYPGNIKLTMRVWVKRSALADRLLNRSETAGAIDGARASVQLATLNRERARGDQLVASVLKDFPRRAFDIDLKAADIVRNQRRAIIEIPFVITWNQDYLRSLWAALDATSTRASPTVAVIGLNSGSLFGFGGQARYDDTAKFELVNNALVRSNPGVLITLRSDDNRVVYRQCSWWTPWNFVEVSIYRPSAFVNGAAKLRATAQIPVQIATLETINRVEIDVVNEAQCPKN